jgi:hypothetical protein
MLKMHFDNPSSQRGRARLASTLEALMDEKHNERSFRTALNEKMEKHCPTVDFVIPGSSGVCITDFQDAMTRLLEHSHWQRYLSFDDSTEPVFLINKIQK